jgi:hypothetical protein
MVSVHLVVMTLNVQTIYACIVNVLNARMKLLVMMVTNALKVLALLNLPLLVSGGSMLPSLEVLLF